MAGEPKLVPLFLMFEFMLYTAGSTPPEIDPRGYVMFCPCMGRFGNQADHYLGALTFVRALDRTLVLPPWVEYRPGQRKSVQIPFNTYFKVEPLRSYLRVITMEDFMRTIAHVIWPRGQRISFCYVARSGTDNCDAKGGNPFGPFWDTFDIDFDRSEMFSPLYYSAHHEDTIAQWNEKYPAEKYPVLAFAGAPAPFPIQESDIGVQKYFVWSDDIEKQASEFIQREIERPFIGIHLRNGIDWKNACDHVTEDRPHHMFDSAQCLGFHFEHGQMSKDLCFPPDKDIIRQLKDAVKKYKAKTVFIATDDRDMMDDFKKVMKKTSFVKYSSNSPHVDLAVLGQADYFLGNCVSTFSAFAKRERDVKNLPSGFFSFKSKKDEL